jgi:hypothetical protein
LDFRFACLYAAVPARSQAHLPVVLEEQGNKRYALPEASKVWSTEAMAACIRLERKQRREWPEPAGLGVESPEVDAFLRRGADYDRVVEDLREALNWPSWIPISSYARLGSYVFRSFNLARAMVQVALRWEEEECLLVENTLRDRLLERGLSNDFIPIFKGSKATDWSECIAEWVPEPLGRLEKALCKCPGFDGLICSEACRAMLLSVGCYPLQFDKWQLGKLE